MNASNARQRGFTLIELFVVIVTIAILADASASWVWVRKTYQITTCDTATRKCFLPGRSFLHSSGSTGGTEVQARAVNRTKNFLKPAVEWVSFGSW